MDELKLIRSKKITKKIPLSKTPLKSEIVQIGRKKSKNKAEKKSKSKMKEQNQSNRDKKTNVIDISNNYQDSKEQPDNVKNLLHIIGNKSNKIKGNRNLIDQNLSNKTFPTISSSNTTLLSSNESLHENLTKSKGTRIKKSNSKIKIASFRKVIYPDGKSKAVSNKIQ